MEDSLEIRAARVYIGGGQVKSPGFIQVRQGRIQSVGQGGSGEAKNVIDLGDATLLPGLVDAHAHITLSGDGRTYEEQVHDPDELMTLIAVRNLRRHLESGVTTLRDNGGRNRTTFVVREAIRRGYISGPRLLLAGRPLTHTGGHFHWCNGVADGEVAIRAAVRELVAEGADHIKIMASGGATRGNWPFLASYDASELRCAVDTAHALQRPTTAHCRARQSMANAVEAGCDCIEHAEYLVAGEMVEHGVGIPASGVIAYDPRLTARIVEAGTYVSFTLQAGGFSTLKRLRQGLADGVALTCREEAQREALEMLFEAKLRLLGDLLRDGLKPRLVISTDAGPFDTAFGELQDGIELAVEAGMSPSEAIDSVTRIAAEACHVDSEVGALRPGRAADVLAVEGDPRHDIRSLRQIREVFIGGSPVIGAITGSAVR